MVDLYLDPEIASPRKSLFGMHFGARRVHGRNTTILRTEGESFAALVARAHRAADPSKPPSRTWARMGSLSPSSRAGNAVADSPPNRGRYRSPAAKRRAMSYLRSVFPGQFVRFGRRRCPGKRQAPGGVGVRQRRLFAIERQSLFQDSWQFVAHQREFRVPEFYRRRTSASRRAWSCAMKPGKSRVPQQLQRAPHILIAARPATST